MMALDERLFTKVGNDLVYNNIIFFELGPTIVICFAGSAYLTFTKESSTGAEVVYARPGTEMKVRVKR